MLRRLLLICSLGVTDIVLFGAIVRYFPLPSDIDLQSKMMSAFLAHWFMAGFWLSFGGMKAPLRQFLFTSMLVLVCAFTAPLDAVPWMAFVRLLLVLAVTWFFYAAMFFPRRLGGLRIGFARGNEGPAAKPQFGLGVLLGFIAVISIPLALTRFAFAVDAQLAKQAIFELALFFGPTCATVLPLSIAIFATRHRWLKLSLSLGWCLLATFAMQHFHPPTAGGQIYWEPVPAILALVWVQVAVNLFAARLLGLKWLGTRVSEHVAGRLTSATWRRELQWAVIQLFSLIVACFGGLLILFAPNALQFTVAYVLAAVSPVLIFTVHFWRRARPVVFWLGFCVAGFLPWCYAMFVGTKEAWTLLVGTPTLASTSPVEVTPSNGLDWSEVIMILIAPFVFGVVGGLIGMCIHPALSWRRTKLYKGDLVKPLAIPIAMEK